MQCDERDHSRISILGSQYSALSFSEICSRVMERAKNKKSGYVCVSNVHTTMMGVFDKSYQNITNSSTYSVPDGQPIRWAMRLLGAKDQERVRGPSLMKAICESGQSIGLKHYLYGSSERTLTDLCKILREKYPEIQIVGSESPPFRPLRADETTKNVERINSSGAEIVWVGLGAPKQEIWMWEQRNLVKPFMLGVGAAFDLLGEKIPEAPAWMQRLGLEWFYRICKEPKRLWRRYVLNNPLFVLFFTVQYVGYLCQRSMGGRR